MWQLKNGVCVLCAGHCRLRQYTAAQVMMQLLCTVEELEGRGGESCAQGPVQVVLPHTAHVAQSWCMWCKIGALGADVLDTAWSRLCADHILQAVQY